MNDDEHPTRLFGAEPKNLGLALATLRYDALAVVLSTLGAELLEASKAEEVRGRPNLAVRLADAAVYADITGADLGWAWEICKTFMGGVAR